MAELDVKIGRNKDIGIRPKEDVSVCTKFCDNPSSSTNKYLKVSYFLFLIHLKCQKKAY